MHGCGIANMGFIQGAIKLRAEEALAKALRRRPRRRRKGAKPKRNLQVSR